LKWPPIFAMDIDIEENGEEDIVGDFLYAGIS